MADQIITFDFATLTQTIDTGTMLYLVMTMGEEPTQPNHNPIQKMSASNGQKELKGAERLHSQLPVLRRRIASTGKTTFDGAKSVEDGGGPLLLGQDHQWAHETDENIF